MKSSKYILFPIFFIIFIDNFGYSLLFNMLGPMLLKPEYGMMAQSTSLVIKNMILSLTFGIFPLMQFFTAPVIGEFADIYGRKKAFYISLLGMVIGFLLSAWAVFVHSILLFILSRLITGIFAGNISISLAAIADISEDEKVRGKNFSVVTALFGISWILAMIAGGYVANPNLLGQNGPAFVFLFTAALTLINFILIIFMYEDTLIKGNLLKFSLFKGLSNIKETLIYQPSRIYFLIYFLWSLGWVMAVQWFPAYAIEVFNVSVDDLTTWYIVMGITWVLGALFAKYYLINRLSTLSSALTGFFFMTFSLYMMQYMRTFFLFSTFFIVGSFFAVFAMSSSLNLISFSGRGNAQGKIMGLCQSVQSSGFVFVSLIAFLVSLYTISILFFFAASISALGLFLLIYKAIQNKKIS